MNNRLTTSPEMVVEVLYDEPIEVLMAANHPLAQYEWVPGLELTVIHKWCLRMAMQRLVQERFERLGATLQAVLEEHTRCLPRSGAAGTTSGSAATGGIGGSSSRYNPCRPQPSHGSAGSLTEGSSLTRRVVMVTTQDRLQFPDSVLLAAGTKL